MAKVIFSFDDKSTRKLKNKKYILGGKGANLGEMGRLGLPVPPGFTISTNVCDIFYKNKKKLPKKVIQNIELELKNIDGEEEARTNGFTILSGTGRWKFLIGQKCIGATARISDFKEGTNNAAFEWKGKCKIPDSKYKRFKNYKEN